MAEIYTAYYWPEKTRPKFCIDAGRIQKFKKCDNTYITYLLKKIDLEMLPHLKRITSTGRGRVGGGNTKKYYS